VTNSEQVVGVGVGNWAVWGGMGSGGMGGLRVCVRACARAVVGITGARVPVQVSMGTLVLRSLPCLPARREGRMMGTLVLRSFPACLHASLICRCAIEVAQHTSLSQVSKGALVRQSRPSFLACAGGGTPHTSLARRGWITLTAEQQRRARYTSLADTECSV
jgi:hypothetical protein